MTRGNLFGWICAIMFIMLLSSIKLGNNLFLYSPSCNAPVAISHCHWSKLMDGAFTPARYTTASISLTAMPATVKGDNPLCNIWPRQQYLGSLSALSFFGIQVEYTSDANNNKEHREFKKRLQQCSGDHLNVHANL